MLKWIAIGLALLLPCVVQAQQTTAPVPAPTAKKAAKPTPPKGTDVVPLNDVIVAVENALNAYQSDPDVINAKLPGISTADFDFKAVVDTKVGGGINFWIIKIGASLDKQTTTDIDFQYVPQSQVSVESVEPKDFEKQLIDTLKEAAATVAMQEAIQKQLSGTSKDPLVFKQMTVSLGYGITKDISGGINAPIHLITLSGTLEKSKNSVQTVKLLFAPPKKKGDGKESD